ncbi:MAG: YjjG family noncanonical pyrimidine nucleotidase [Actinomycetota bacterium]
MRYTTLLFDLDFTLIDGHTSEAAAFDYTLRRAGAVDPADYLAPYVEINTVLWAAVERGDITPNDVRTERFAQLIAATDLEADPQAMGDDFVYGMGANGNLYPGTVETLDALAQVATLALVTNGIGEVQRARIARLDLDKYFDAIVISGEVGVAKPGLEIYDLTFAKLDHPDKATTLMIGDSLSSDMAGGINYGIATCWYATHSDAPTPAGIDHRITDLAELLPIVTA